MVGWISRQAFVELKVGDSLGNGRRIGEAVMSEAKALCEGRTVKDISHSVLTYAPFDFAIVNVIGREE